MTERGEDFSEALVHRLANAGRHQGPTVCLLVKGSDWRCRPIAVRRLALKLPDGSAPADAEAEAEIGWVIELIEAIRSIRSEMSIPQNAPLTR